MAGKSKGPLTDAAIRAKGMAAGLHSDGDGLYLSVTASGAKSWRFIWSADKRRREMGLGTYPEISLKEAREMAIDARRVVAAGGDPIAERRQAREAAAAATDAPPERTFSTCVTEFLASMETGWKNAKHRAQWRMTLTEYCKPLADKPISQVNTENVLEVLKPLWATRPETASRLRGRIERVIDYARAQGWRTGENPARWRGHLASILPAPKKLQRGHHAALPYKDVPAFVTALRARKATSALALEFLILTAARSGEVREARWGEFDLDAGIWTIPAARMKMKREHRVPLVGRALEIVREMAEVRISDFVFPGQKENKPLSNMVFDLLMQRMEVEGITAHGFRSAFRDWAGDETSFAREIAEQALAHRVGDATERAYRRGDALEKRKALMQAWADYIEGKVEGGNVVPLVKSSAA